MGKTKKEAEAAIEKLLDPERSVAECLEDYVEYHSDENPPIKIECTHRCSCKATSSWDIFLGIIFAAAAITLGIVALLP